MKHFLKTATITFFSQLLGSLLFAIFVKSESIVSIVLYLIVHFFLGLFTIIIFNLIKFTGKGMVYQLIALIATAILFGLILFIAFTYLHLERIFPSLELNFGR